MNDGARKHKRDCTFMSKRECTCINDRARERKRECTCMNKRARERQRECACMSKRECTYEICAIRRRRAWQPEMLDVDHIYFPNVHAVSLNFDVALVQRLSRSRSRVWRAQARARSDVVSLRPSVPKALGSSPASLGRLVSLFHVAHTRSRGMGASPTSVG